MKIKFAHIAFIVLIVFLLIFSGCIKKKGEGNEVVDENIPIEVTDSNEQIINGGDDEEFRPVPSELRIAIENCLSKATGAETADLCLVELAKVNNSDEPCRRVSAIAKSRCVKEVAVVTMNVKFCDKIVDSGFKDSCLHDLGILLKDVSSCRRISDVNSSDDCKIKVALLNSSPSECGLIFQPIEKDECYISVAGSNADLAFCENVSVNSTELGIARDRCYEANAQSYKNGEVCAKVTDKQQRNKCFFDATTPPSGGFECGILGDANTVANCNFWLGRSTGNAAYCYNTTSSLEELCIKKIIESGVTAEQCTAIRNYQFENECFVKAAIENASVEVCDQIDSNSLLRDLCITDVALVAKNGDYCSKVRSNNISGKDSCFAQTALALGNHELCERVQTDKAYYSCFADIALLVEAEEVCEQADRQKLRLLPYSGTQYCYFDFAVKKRDERLCDKISFTSLQDGCREEIERKQTCITGDNICDGDICTYEDDRDCDEDI